MTVDAMGTQNPEEFCYISHLAGEINVARILFLIPGRLLTQSYKDRTSKTRIYSNMYNVSAKQHGLEPFPGDLHLKARK